MIIAIRAASLSYLLATRISLARGAAGMTAPSLMDCAPPGAALPISVPKPSGSSGNATQSVRPFADHSMHDLLGDRPPRSRATISATADDAGPHGSGGRLNAGRPPAGWPRRLVACGSGFASGNDGKPTLLYRSSSATARSCRRATMAAHRSDA